MLILNIIEKIKISIVLAVIIFEYAFYPYPIIAKANYEYAQNMIQVENNGEAGPQTESPLTTESKPATFAVLPENAGLSISRVTYNLMTAYTSEVNQCDLSPCITATGFNVCKHGIEDTIAANFLPFGTRVRIPDYFGETIFVVRDRMNKRHNNRIDIWMQKRDLALKFGKKFGKIEIIE
jgi:3D (Asp-Asp-Asp) domain-containing protein